jgi:dTDP-4-dehydrorhamnose 3,5-epimerase
MRRIDTPIPDLYIIKPTVFEDSRGYFFEAFNADKFAALGFEVQFVQDNESLSSKDVIRGLHYQLAPYAQSKLVRVVQGAILDVAVDIRKNSPTYGKHFAYELNAENKCLLFIPRGFAHGFSVLSETAIVNYKCDALYNAAAERGIRFNDPNIGIDWKVDASSAIVSAKDNVLPLFKSIETNFVYGGNY